MSVYKEAMFIIRSLKSQQKQIYSDAADFGIPIFSESDQAIKDVKSLKDQYFTKDDTREINEYYNQKDVRLNITMLDEFGDGEPFDVKISYIRFISKSSLNKSMHGKIIGILSIDSPKW